MGVNSSSSRVMVEGSDVNGGELAGVIDVLMFSIFSIKYFRNFSQCSAEVVQTVAGVGFIRLLMVLKRNLRLFFFVATKLEKYESLPLFTSEIKLIARSYGVYELEVWVFLYLHSTFLCTFSFYFSNIIIYPGLWVGGAT